MAEGVSAFVVAFVGERDLVPAADLERLLEQLVNRHQDTRRICLMSVARGPELRWCQSRGWTLIFEPENRNTVKRDCALVATADALVVLGDPAPWQRLPRLCREARIPTRVYRCRPRLPPRREYPAEG